MSCKSYKIKVGFRVYLNQEDNPLNKNTELEWCLEAAAPRM